MGPVGTYQIFTTKGQQGGGMMKKMAEEPAPHWLYYITVDAIDAAGERVKSAGGKIVHGPVQVPGGSWIVNGLDPQGAMFALVARENGVNEPGRGGGAKAPPSSGIHAGDRPMNAEAQVLTSAAELARESTRCGYPTKARSIAPRARRCSSRRSNCAVISSASRRSAGRCRRAARSSATIAFRERMARRISPDCSETSRPSPSTATCSGRSAARPCPMCTNVWAPGRAMRPTSAQKISLAVVARSPIERLIAWKKERGWRDLRLYSDLNGAYSRDYFGHPAERLRDPGLQRVHPPRRNDPPFLVGRDGGVTADPGQDPRGAPDPAPSVDGARLDAGRAGRGLVSEARLRVARSSRGRRARCVSW